MICFEFFSYSFFSFSDSAVVILKFPFLTIQSNGAAKPVFRAEERVFKNRLKSLPGIYDDDEKLTDAVFCTLRLRY